MKSSDNNGYSDSTTQAAISQGTIVIRDQDKQKQDVAGLSRDAQNANDRISKIFDKEKEQRRMEQAQLIGEISSQVGKIVSTYGEITAQKALRDSLARKAATGKLIEDGNAAPSREEIDK